MSENTPHDPIEQPSLNQGNPSRWGRFIAYMAGHRRTEQSSDQPHEVTIPDSIIDWIDEYAEKDGLTAVPLPRVDSLAVDGRTINVVAETGEQVSEASYLEMLRNDLQDKPDFLHKMQWMGEAELVHALAEQTKWLVGRMKAGEHLLIADESWHRKDIKSGGFITRLIVDAARSVANALPEDLPGALITDDEFRQNPTSAIDRVVLFEDWVDSGHDMALRVNCTRQLIAGAGIPESKISINLLAAQTSILENGLHDYFTGKKEGGVAPVIAPYEIIDSGEHPSTPFSGIHSDVDYSFTEKPEMKPVIAQRTPEGMHASAYHIASATTLGNPSFYSRIEQGMIYELGLDGDNSRQE